MTLILTGCGEYSLKEYDAESHSYEEARHKLKSWGTGRRSDYLIVQVIDKLEERVSKLEAVSQTLPSHSD